MAATFLFPLLADEPPKPEKILPQKVVLRSFIMNAVIAASLCCFCISLAKMPKCEKCCFWETGQKRGVFRGVQNSVFVVYNIASKPATFAIV